MQSTAFNKKYAKSISELEGKVSSVESSPADLLDLLRENETYDFGSGLVLDYQVLGGCALYAAGWF